MFGGLFDFSRGSPSPSCSCCHPGYGFNGYYAQPQNYPARRGFGMPVVEPSSNMRHRQRIPVEIPVVCEGSGGASTNEATKPRKPDASESVQPSPKHHRKERSMNSYPKEQVPSNNMDASDDDDNEGSLPFYASMFPNAFESGFPFSQRNSRNRPTTTERPHGRTAPKGTNPNSRPNSTNVPAEKATSQQTAANKAPKTEQRRNDKSRTVPTVAEEVVEDSRTAAEQTVQPQSTKQSSPIEQMEIIKMEMKEIENRIINFSGEKKNKEYIFLDEAMTSVLLKLDMIESNGIVEIRNKRRELVRFVQEYVKQLERKVGILSNDEDISSGENMEATEDEASEDDKCEDAEKTLDISDEHSIS